MSRIWYSGARDGVIYPKFMSRLHPKHRTPGNVMIVWLGISFVLDLILGLIYGPTNAGLVLLTMAGIAIIVVHIVANTSLTLFSRNYLKKTGQSSILLHYIAPTVASILGIIVIYFTVESNIATYLSDPTTINLAYMVIVIFAVLWVVIGATAVTLYYKFKRPDIIAKAGVYDAEVAE